MCATPSTQSPPAASFRPAVADAEAHLYEDKQLSG